MRGASQFPESVRVIIKGAGDLATGIALRLFRSGFAVIMTELAQPLAVRRTVAFAQAVFDGEWQVEGVPARRVPFVDVDETLAAQAIPILVEPSQSELSALRAPVWVDAIMAKRNMGTRSNDAPLVIALGPGFTAGIDCHAVIETQRGHNLGRVIWQGAAEPNTGVPGEIAGAGPSNDRVLRAPESGHVEALVEIGDQIAEGAVYARLRNDTNGVQDLRAPFSGALRGLIHPSVHVTPGAKIGDLDARAQRDACFTVSDKSLAIGGGVLEAILSRRHSVNAYIEQLKNENHS
jgi:xanthine dehydrogenase accessory factor